ncbi:MAG: IS1380 family transposase [Spirochaetota bacterium]|nr:IS1380 family transposase [Spirochaetota bacterium]
MTQCTKELPLFPACKRKNIHLDFTGGCVTSDAGALLLRNADRKIGLTKAIDRVLNDPRRQGSCTHSQLSMLKQRIYGLCLGYEDLNDHQTLRHDIGFQTAVEAEAALASSATLCRLENRANRKMAWEINTIMVETFITSFKKPPKELILDFDATDDRVHGGQEGRFFHGYYDEYCFLPLYVFCGERLLVSYLRESKIDPAKHAWAILSLLVKRFRRAWPGVKIVFRADSGFCRWRLMRWCDSHDVKYVIGIAKNSRLNEAADEHIEEARKRYEETGQKQRIFADILYGARTWERERRVIVKAEHTHLGSNPRYVVTNMDEAAQYLYEELYCARGNMENRIKEQQLDMFSDRTSCHRWWPNQLRLLLSSLAYVLIETIRRIGLRGTQLARAQCGTIRLKLFKLGAIVRRNTRRVRFHCSSGYPYQELLFLVAHRLAAG